MKDQSHRSTLSGAVRSGSAWRVSALILGAIAFILAVTAWHLSEIEQTVLVPWGLYSSNSEVKVTGIAKRDARYLSLLALSDLDDLLTWQPKTISVQMDRFLARLTPKAYATYNLNLRSQVTQYAQNNLSEVFYPDKVDLISADTIRVRGSLARYEGAQRTFTTSVSYTITYSRDDGVYAIKTLEAKQK